MSDILEKLKKEYFDTLGTATDWANEVTYYTNHADPNEADDIDNVFSFMIDTANAYFAAANATKAYLDAMKGENDER